VRKRTTPHVQCEIVNEAAQAQGGDYATLDNETRVQSIKQFKASYDKHTTYFLIVIYVYLKLL